MKESEFQKNVISLAKQLGWLVYHTYDSRMCEPGFPDLVLVKHKTLFRELKTQKGRLTKEQVIWQDKLIGNGSDYAIWRPSDMQAIAKQLSERITKNGRTPQVDNRRTKANGKGSRHL